MKSQFRYRILTRALLKAVKTFPAVVVTGPRQSGKTTLLKHVFGKKYAYASLEDPDTRLRAHDDPRAFLEQYDEPLIIDEIQYLPELLSFIKSRIDQDRRPGRYILTGSQNFVLMQGVSQSLAGRAAILSLLPLSYAELMNAGERSVDVTAVVQRTTKKIRPHSSPSPDDAADLILRGWYPEVAVNKRVDRQLWCSSYISTFLERDIRSVAHVGDLSQFGRFLRLCASRTGQIVNMSDLARDIGISVTTAKRWLSVLEAGYQIFLLYPYYKNIGKRLIKSPKLYFTDTALASYLLGINDKRTLLLNPQFPHLFETFIVVDFLKRFLHHGQMPSLYYLRTRDGLEVDLVLELGTYLYLYEIKSSQTITIQHAASLARAAADLREVVKGAGVISRTRESFLLRETIVNHCWKDLLLA